MSWNLFYALDNFIVMFEIIIVFEYAGRPPTSHATADLANTYAAASAEMAG